MKRSTASHEHAALPLKRVGFDRRPRADMKPETWVLLGRGRFADEGPVSRGRMSLSVMVETSGGAPEGKGRALTSKTSP